MDKELYYPVISYSIIKSQREVKLLQKPFRNDLVRAVLHPEFHP